MMSTSIFIFFTLAIFLGSRVYGVIPYDYGYVLGCMPKPEPPLYDGGIAINPEFNDGLTGWTAAGNAEIAHAQSPDGNGYAVVSNSLTALPSDGLSHIINVEKGLLYTVSAWFRISEGEATVYVELVTSSGNTTANFITAKAGCWTMLKGGFHGKVTEPARLRFAPNSTGFDMLVDSVSVQPFTQEEWTSHQAESVEKVRKTRVKFEVVDELGNPVADAAVTIKQREPHFPFGCTMNGLIVENQAYQKWFLERFRYSVFENELKWNNTEGIEGVEDYSLPDAMLEFAKKHGIVVRGHNILWDDPRYLPLWLNNSSDAELKEAALRRVTSVVNRYKGQFIHWDVINENMHYSKFSALTNNGSEVYSLAHQLDPLPVPFLNEYAVVEAISLQARAVPSKYLQKIQQIRNSGYDGPLGIGIQGHFGLGDATAEDINMPYIRAAIDIFHATSLPIWVTEFDLDTNTKASTLLPFMEPLLREFHSHPYLDGIILWGVPNIDKCFLMCLTDAQFNNLPAGDILDKFISEFIRVPDTTGKTDIRGIFEASLFLGGYDVTIARTGGAHHSHRKIYLTRGGEVTAVKLSPING